jgi:hypothetical protein
MLSLLICGAVLQADDLVAPRTSEIGIRTSAATSSGVSSGVVLEHALTEYLTLGAAIDVGFRSSPLLDVVTSGGLTVTGAIPGVGVAGSTTTITVHIEPLLRRYLGDRPFEGVFIGASVPAGYSRATGGVLNYSWQVGLFAEAGYSLLVAQHLVIQAVVGAGLTYSVATLADLKLESYSAGLRSSLTFGYAF